MTPSIVRDPRALVLVKMDDGSMMLAAVVPTSIDVEVEEEHHCSLRYRQVSRRETYFRLEGRLLQSIWTWENPDDALDELRIGDVPIAGLLSPAP